MIMFFVVFLFGFFVGYFFEKSDITYTETLIDKLKTDLENMRLEQMFIMIEPSEKSCAAMTRTIKDTSYSLYTLVNRLKQTKPESREFYKLKREADFLSLKAWMLSTSIEEKCDRNILTILFVYSTDSPACVRQDKILQDIKTKYEDRVLVYAIDYYLDESVIRMINDVYGIGSTPAMIIRGEVYGALNETELSKLVCDNLRDCVID